MLTVSAVTSGTVNNGDYLTGVGIAPGTHITSLGTGSGGTGTYNLSISNTVSSGETITLTNGRVSKLYDQTGGGRHLVQATDGNRPRLVFNATGSVLPGLYFLVASGSQIQLSAIQPSVPQPFTVSHVFNKTPSTAVYGIQQRFTVNTQGSSSLGSAANSYGINAGSTLNRTTGVNDAAWHATQDIYQNTTSSINVDGATTSGTAGTGTAGSGGSGVWEIGDLTNKFGGFIPEVGLWPVKFAAGDITAMNSNQHSYWGF